MKKSPYLLMAAASFLLLACKAPEANKPVETPTGDTLTSKEIVIPVKQHTDLSQFVPKGYKILKGIQGDINKDAAPDYVLVMQPETDGDFDVEAAKRITLLLTGEAGGPFTLAKRNDNIVYCWDCAGTYEEPLVDVTINEGTITFKHQGGGANVNWNRTVAYAYNAEAKDWYLVQDDTITESTVDNKKKTEESKKTEKEFGKISFEQHDLKN